MHRYDERHRITWDWRTLEVRAEAAFVQRGRKLISVRFKKTVTGWHSLLRTLSAAPVIGLPAANSRACDARSSYRGVERHFKPTGVL